MISTANAAIDNDDSVGSDTTANASLETSASAGCCLRLELCRGDHHQLYQLRRAKPSAMMVLHHLPAQSRRP